MNQSTLPLRPYLEIIDKLCRSLDRDSLQQCIVALAKQVNPEERQVFLQNLQSVLPGNEHREIGIAMIEESCLMNEMDTIRREIEHRLKAIEALTARADHDEHHACLGEEKKVLH